MKLGEEVEVGSGSRVIEITKRRAGDIAASYADAAKAKELLGWQAVSGLEKMCADSWRFTVQNPNGME